MPAPTSYANEDAFVTFLLNDRQLSAAWSVLGLTEDTAGEELAEVVADTLLTMGVSLISEVVTADMIKLRTLGRYFAWKMIAGQHVPDTDYSADGENFKRGQLFEHANKMLEMLEGEAAPYLGRYKVQTGKIVDNNSPYTPAALTERFTLDRWE